MRFVGTALVAGTIGVFFLLADGGWIRAGTGTGRIVKADSAPTQSNRSEGGHFNELVGKTVENVDGEKIGTIKDLILQRRSGEVHYMIVKSSAFSHRRLVIVPLSAIAMTTAKVGTASIDVSTRQWKKAPEFRKQDVVLLAEPERAQSIGRFYQRADGFLRSAQDSETRPALTSTGRKAGRPPPSQQKTELLMASDIVGKEVINREQKKLGEVMDLLINFSEKKPALALVLVIARQGSEAANSFAVPVRLLNPAQNGNLQINADRESFEHAQPFSFEERSSLERDQNEIYRWDGR